MGVTTYNDHDELTDEEFHNIKDLVLKAKDYAYCPYSNFRVGCIVLTQEGEFIRGANVENASYGAGVCAERSALTKAVTEGYKNFKAIAISGDTNEPIVPCGICRQFIREFNKNITIFLFNKDGEFIKVYLKDLLPMSFGPEDLGVKTG
ncbi:uncharacterized protein KGF55_001215 [Candida pseudojiufengensis]|uniref:uncharacterized protein n=1 Tax=Candida pseudojiufengensis TaxID=497109 RepID=UPI002224DD15|nr:uncharacterized protein KGF55_001215 [Candida pseudojiufengensis]KAI5965852.1 hypothetical protein KGF55_001215 [Candida pseudojiufengensis]